MTPSPLLALEGVSWQAGAGPFNLVVQTGERVALLGDEGCGKSRLLRVMAGLTPALAGQVVLDGRAVSAWDGAERVARLGVVFQETTRQWLLPQVGEEVALAAARLGLQGEALAARVREALALAGLDAALESASMAQLALSTQSRVLLAAALVTRPRLLLLDEPGAALSEAGEAEVATRLARYCTEHNASLVLLTSRPSRARLFATRVVEMVNKP